MRVSRDRHHILPPEEGTVISIGVFDGVHLGHQEILRENVKRAKELGAVPTVVTFSAHPKSVLLGRAPRTLTTLAHRLELFERAGIGYTVALPFDEELRDIPARKFIEEFLIEELRAKAFVLGFDSKFGAGREGTPELLREMGHDTLVVQKVVVSDRAVSSTAIREAVELGDLEGARRMLGRRVCVLGEVVSGVHLGRKLGFPTANLNLSLELHPPVGVYAGLAHRLRDGSDSAIEASYHAVCNIGFRPTVDGNKPEHPLVEVHLLDFSGDLYGCRLELEFVAALRGEQRFDSLEALVAQIRLDVGRAREILAREPPLEAE
jgi:riboflavin kinase / FMN adenylyltransferase